MAKGLTAQSVERLKPDPAKRLEIPDGLLPGLYFIIQRTGARAWAVRYRHAGKPRKLTLGPYPALDLGTARARAREALQAVALGRDPGAEKIAALRAARENEPDRDSVAAVVERFLQRHTRAKNRRQSAEAVERTFRRVVLPAWGTRRIQEITRRDIVQLLDEVVDRGTPVLANRTLAHVRKLFNWARLQLAEETKDSEPTLLKARGKSIRLKSGDRVDIAVAGKVVINQGYVKVRQTAYDGRRHGI